MIVVKVRKIRSYQTLVYKNGNRTYRTKDYKDYIQEIGLQLGRLKAVKGEYELKLLFHFNKGTTIDIDNAIKPISDILELKGKVDNDRKCVHLFARKIIDRSLKMPEIHIELRKSK